MSPLADLAGNSSAELAFFRAFSHEGSRDLLLTLLTNADIATILADELWPRFVALAQPGAASAGELHAKFVEEGSGFDLEYAGLKNFFGGLEAVVGAPNPNVLSGMRREHCNEVDSIEPFITPNYKMQTTTRIEWWFVEDPKAGLSELKLESWPVEAPEMIKGSARGRVPLPVSAFDSAFGEVNAKLTELSMPTILVEEFLGCRMYTGPCFVKYNTVLRGLQSSIPFFRDKFTDLCKGNKYTTSLHVINSAVVKLSKLTIAEKVYRGVSGGRLPRNFRHANEYGVRGGVDPAFMSTTLDREVAMTYAGSSSGPGVVFSIQQGMVDRGADIGWLSQCAPPRAICLTARTAQTPTLVPCTTRHTQTPSEPKRCWLCTCLPLVQVPAREGDPLRASRLSRDSKAQRRRDRPRSGGAPLHQPERRDDRAGDWAAAQAAERNGKQHGGRGVGGALRLGL